MPSPSSDTNHIEQRARELLAAECNRTVEGMRYDAYGVVPLNVALSAISRALSAGASAGEEDYRTHHDDFRVACLVAQAHATSDADCSYWQHQVDVLDRIKAAASQPAQAGASGGGDGYVHSVPDKCDRITWRGHYYHLTFHSRPEKIAPASPATGEGKEKLVPDWSRAYQRDGQTFVPMQPAARPAPEADARDGEVSEGCTPTDAKVLRTANHRMVDQLVAITSLLTEHPTIDGKIYDGPCRCAECISYASDDESLPAQGREGDRG